MPPVREATAGSPHAAASTSAIPSASKTEGKTKRSAARRTSSTRSTRPAKRTRPASPRSADATPQLVLDGERLALPGPDEHEGRPGTSPATAANASRSVSSPLPRSSRPE